MIVRRHIETTYNQKYFAYMVVSIRPAKITQGYSTTGVAFITAVFPDPAMLESQVPIWDVSVVPL